MSPRETTPKAPIHCAGGDTVALTMPRQNRVTPFGDLVADPARGLVYGNRGCLHDGQGTIRRRYAGKRWISCRLEFRGWQRGQLLSPGRFTELFFLDEATAFAAGHRPCALCRNEDYQRFVALWHELHPGDGAGADAIDARLHAERVETGPRAQRSATLQRGVRDVAGRDIRRLEDERPSSCGETGCCGGRRPATTRRRPDRDGPATVLTPPSLVAVLPQGWEGVVPLLHPSARSTAHRRETCADASQRPRPCFFSHSPTRRTCPARTCPSGASPR